MLNLSKNRRSGEEVDWKDKFAICLWWLWRWRNNQIFGNKVVAIERKISLMHGYCKDVQSTFCIQDIALGSHMRVATFSIGWRSLSFDCFKFNTDGCWRVRDSVASGGGVLRDHCGDWQWGFNVKVEQCSFEEAELWALIIGLRQAWDIGFY